MTDNNSDSTQTFIIRVKKSDGDNIKNFSSASLIKSLLEKGSFFKVEEILETGKKLKH